MGALRVFHPKYCRCNAVGEYSDELMYRKRMSCCFGMLVILRHKDIQPMIIGNIVLLLCKKCSEDVTGDRYSDEHLFLLLFMTSRCGLGQRADSVDRHFL